MTHLKRAGALLLVILAVVFVVPRLVPASAFLDEYGFYNKSAEENAQEWAGLQAQYADPLICGDCHQDKHDTWEKSEHSSVSCENCHGPGEAHTKDLTRLVVDTSRESCGLCHGRVFARRGTFPQVDMSEHGGLSNCVACHNPHDPAGEELPVIPQPLEGRDECLLCHGSGGMEPSPEDHEGRGQDTCLNCHQSK